MSEFRSRRVTGSVMVEMAGAIALLVFLVFGITELGRALYQLNTINKAVTSGARYLARTPEIIGIPDGDPPCNTLAGWAAASDRAQNFTIYGDESGAGEPLLLDMVVEVAAPEVRSFSTDTGNYLDCVVTVHAEAPFHSLFGDNVYPPLFGGEAGDGVMLKADAEERYLRIYYAPSAP